MQGQPYSSYFLFINSGSGGGVGQNLLEQQKAQKISFDISLQDHLSQNNKKKIDIYFYNLKTSREKGFKNLKAITQKNLKSRLIICGGDGSVIWVISQLYNHNIDTDKTPIGIIPLGTGNDFSQFLGWGKVKSTLTQNNFKSLKKLVRKWEAAQVQNFDVWDMKAQVFQYGKFEKVQKFENVTLPTKVIQKSFCNYFSFGLDGKIGYSFDLHRTQSRIGNLAMYGLLGLAKAMTKTKTLRQLVYGMEVRHEFTQEIQQQGISSTLKPKSSIKWTKQIEQHENNNSKQPQNCLNRISTFMNKQSTQQQSNLPINVDSQKRIANTQNSNKQSRISLKQKFENKKVFVTKNSKKQKRIQQEKVLQLKNQYYNIVALNINSFMGGVFDIWKNAKSAFKNSTSQSFTQMSASDGKLQFVSFASSIGMAAERSFSGNGQKIAQGGGPYYFEFKPYDPRQKHRTYLQFDGQFIRFTHPKSVLIRKSRYGKNGRIKVLRNLQNTNNLKSSV